MLVPRARLLLWFALIVVPFATLAGAVPNTWPVAAACIALFVLVAALDALRSPARLRGVSLTLEPLVRTTQGRPFALPVRLHNPSQRARTLRLTFAFPPEIISEAEEMTLSLPSNAEWSSVEWKGTCNTRGRFRLSTARSESLSPLGLWAFWKTLPVECEIRAYPNLARERKHLAALFLNRGAYGVHAQRQVGRGRDFEKLREYIPGDSIEDIHWKATAKRSHPVTKVYQIERTQEVYVILDASRLSARPVKKNGAVSNDTSGIDGTAPPETTALERFITAALMLGLAAEHQGDLFGLVTFSDKIETFLRARNGQSHYHACRDALYTLRAREVSPDFDELTTFIRLRLRRRALLLFLTSLEDPVAAESFVRNMDSLSRQHLVVVNMLQPPGARPLFSNAEMPSMDALYGELTGHLRWQQLRELEKVLQRRGVRLSLLESEQLAADLISQYLSVKQRQLL